MLIGDFSKLSLVSVKALRYYDEIGLLKPERVDEFTSYRSYSASQLSSLNRIVTLKNMGLSLDEIAKLLRNDVPVAHVLDLLHSKQVEIKKHLEVEAERLMRVEEWLSETQKRGKMPDYDVKVKKIKPQKAITIRRVLPNYEHVGELFAIISPFLGKVHALVKSPPITLYHDNDFKESDVDVEVAFPLWHSVKVEGEFKMQELPGYEFVASVMHKGNYSDLGRAYNTIARWIDANAYHVIGPNREIYLNEPATTLSEDLMTEVQVPLDKNG
jgi:DNA-binding transcriptional MerR regulator